MRRPLIIKWRRICKLACKYAHADCSASLCWRQRSAKRHLEKGDARKEYTSGFSASFKFCYLPLISSKIRRCITPWKPFAQKARLFFYFSEMSRFTRRDISPCGNVILRPCRSDIRLLLKTSYGKAIGVRVSRVFSARQESRALCLLISQMCSVA